MVLHTGVIDMTGSLTKTKWAVASSVGMSDRRKQWCTGADRGLGQLKRDRQRSNTLLQKLPWNAEWLPENQLSRRSIQILLRSRTQPKYHPRQLIHPVTVRERSLSCCLEGKMKMFAYSISLGMVCGGTVNLRVQGPCQCWSQLRNKLRAPYLPCCNGARRSCMTRCADC